MALLKSSRIGGTVVPTFLYGTAWKEAETKRCVLEALVAGFRGIDTANQRKHYFEEGVGEALREAYDRGIVDREKLFLQSKFTHLGGQDQRLPYAANADVHTQVMQSYASSLQHLQATYLDSYILHGPSRNSGLSDEDWGAWRAMEELYCEGKVRLLGVSNVNLDQLRQLCAGCAVKPNFVQNRCFARQGWDRVIRDFCKANQIVYQGFSLLTANPEVFAATPFRELVARLRCQPAQLIFRFAQLLQMIPLTGTTDVVHMRQDLLVDEINIGGEDLALLERVSESRA